MSLAILELRDRANRARPVLERALPRDLTQELLTYVEPRQEEEFEYTTIPFDRMLDEPGFGRVADSRGNPFQLELEGEISKWDDPTWDLDLFTIKLSESSMRLWTRLTQAWPYTGTGLLHLPVRCERELPPGPGHHRLRLSLHLGLIGGAYPNVKLALPAK